VTAEHAGDGERRGGVRAAAAAAARARESEQGAAERVRE
jgi:hypothetical protein